MPKDGRKDVVQKGLEDVCVCGGGRHFENCYCHVGGTIFMWFYVFFLKGGKVKFWYTPLFWKPPSPPSDFNEMQSKVTWDFT